MDRIELAKLLLTGIGLLLTFGTLIFAILKFQEEKKREFQKSFFESQLDVYLSTVDHASALNIYSIDSEEFDHHLNEYDKLFIGQMCIIEDKMVEERMVQFNQILRGYLKSKKGGSKEISDVLKSELWHFSLVLAHTCRNSSIRIWEIEEDVLGKLYNDYSKWPSEDRQRINICSDLVSGKVELNEAINEINKIIEKTQPKGS